MACATQAASPIERENTAKREIFEGHRRRLGSMKLLGSGAKIADLLSFNTSRTNARGASPISPSVHSPERHAAAAAGGKWVPGPEMLFCHEEIAYHFARDSLVFIPSEKALTWLPTQQVFSPGLPLPRSNGVHAPPPTPTAHDENSLAA